MHLLIKNLPKEIIVHQSDYTIFRIYYIYNYNNFIIYYYRKSNDNSSAALAFYSYDVELLNSKRKQNPNNEPIYRVDGVQIRRSKTCFTRDRCRFFITHNVEFRNGLLSLKVYKL